MTAEERARFHVSLYNSLLAIVRGPRKRDRKEWGRKYRREHREEDKARQLAYCKRHPDRVKACGRAYYHRNREKRVAAHREYTNRPEVRARRREWNRNYYVTYGPKYRANNLERLRLYKRNYEAKRRNTDRRYFLLHTLRKQVGAVVRLRRALKNVSTRELVGCDLGYFIKHIESLFRPGMTWENYGRGNGKWQIDHLMPCASFDLANPEELKRCFHFSNLQPLWWKQNIIKRDKIITAQFQLL